MSKKYKAKISYGLVIFVCLVAYLPVLLSMLDIVSSDDLTLLIVMQTLFLALILYFFFRTSYTVEHNKLKIKCGFYSYKPIDIMTITEIVRSNSLISSPAPSLDRIKIKYGKYNDIILSPEDKLKFANELKNINPEININLD